MIDSLYQAFSAFPKPDRCMMHDESCPECIDHEQTLKMVDVRTLSISDIGPMGYSPISNLNPAALAYFLPRLMEFVLKNLKDCDGEPFMTRFISLIMAGPHQARFELLGQVHQGLILEVLTYIKTNHGETVEWEGWSSELDQAIQAWGG